MEFPPFCAPALIRCPVNVRAAGRDLLACCREYPCARGVFRECWTGLTRLAGGVDGEHLNVGVRIDPILEAFEARGVGKPMSRRVEDEGTP